MQCVGTGACSRNIRKCVEVGISHSTLGFGSRPASPSDEWRQTLYYALPPARVLLRPALDGTHTRWMSWCGCWGAMPCRLVLSVYLCQNEHSPRLIDSSLQDSALCNAVRVSSHCSGIGPEKLIVDKFVKPAMQAVGLPTEHRLMQHFSMALALAAVVSDVAIADQNMPLGSVFPAPNSGAG